MPLLLPYRGILPTIHPTAFIAENAVLVGDVRIGAHSSIWYNCVLRADVSYIEIGERTNIQDGTIIHESRFDGPTRIGNGITVGHKALLHACTLMDDCFIGMGAIIMDTATVHPYAMVAAGALLTNGKNVPTGELWAGSPAKYLRPLKESERAYIPESAENYRQLAEEYRLATTIPTQKA